MTKSFVNKKESRMGMLIFGTLLILLSVVFFMIYFNRQTKDSRTEGTVVDFVVRSGPRHKGIVPKIKFTVDNREYTKEAKRSYFADPFLKVGDKVKIFYSLSSPHNEVAIDSFSANFGPGILSGIIGLLFILIGRSIKYE